MSFQDSTHRQVCRRVDADVFPSERPIEGRHINLFGCHGEQILPALLQGSSKGCIGSILHVQGQAFHQGDPAAHTALFRQDRMWKESGDQLR